MKKDTDYAKKLRDPRWQKKRLEILNRDNFSCTMCGDESKELQVHHNKYDWKLDPWDIQPEFLSTLCKTCHERVTDAIRYARSRSTFDPYLGALEMLNDIFETNYWSAAYASISGIHKHFARKRTNEN